MQLYGGGKLWKTWCALSAVQIQWRVRSQNLVRHEICTDKSVGATNINTGRSVGAAWAVADVGLVNYGRDGARGSALMRLLAGNLGRVALVMLVLAGAVWGQESTSGLVRARRFDSIRILQDGKVSQQSGTSDAQTAPAAKPAKPTAHKFWDTENILLFAGVGAARGLDYASTLNIRRRGLNEALLNNETVDNHAEFAAIEAATTAASVGLSYIFHATGHHRLERWTSYVHIGVTVAGAARNYALKTPHPAM